MKQRGIEVNCCAATANLSNSCWKERERKIAPSHPHPAGEVMRQTVSDIRWLVRALWSLHFRFTTTVQRLNSRSLPEDFTDISQGLAFKSPALITEAGFKRS